MTTWFATTLFVVIIFRVIAIATRWLRPRGKLVERASGAFFVRIRRGRQRQVYGARISVAIPDRLRFSMHIENMVDRAAKNLGVAREWQTGDAAFDQRVFIASEDSVLLDRLTMDARLRATIIALLKDANGQSLMCSRGWLELECGSQGAERSSTDEALRLWYLGRVDKPLADLKRALEGIAAELWQSHRDPALLRERIIGVTAFVLGCVGIVGYLQISDFRDQQVVHSHIDRDTLFVTLTAFGAMLVALFLWLRPSPYTHRALFDSLLAALPGVCLAASGNLTWYNEAQDTSLPEPHRVKVDSLYVTTHKRTNHYHLVVARWPDPHGRRAVEVPYQTYSHIAAGACVGISWHRGALGDGWVAGYDVGTGTCNGEGGR